jgi:hypothetical protein
MKHQELPTDKPNAENQQPDLNIQPDQGPLLTDDTLKKMKQFLDVLTAEIDKSSATNHEIPNS